MQDVGVSAKERQSETHMVENVAGHELIRKAENRA